MEKNETCGALEWLSMFFSQDVHQFREKHFLNYLKEFKKWELKYMDDDFADLTTDAYNFVKSLLCVDITKRLNSDSALTHKWILQTEKRDIILNERYRNLKFKLIDKTITIQKINGLYCLKKFIKFNYLQIWCLILFRLSFYCKHSLKIIYI